MLIDPSGMADVSANYWGPWQRSSWHAINGQGWTVVGGGDQFIASTYENYLKGVENSLPNLIPPLAEYMKNNLDWDPRFNVNCPATIVRITLVLHKERVTSETGGENGSELLNKSF